MHALITGASAGLGRDMARRLDAMGYTLILVARREERLRELAASLKGRSRYLALDIAGAEQARHLYDQVAEEPIDLLINNAGFGLWGPFVESDLDCELAMLMLNIETTHILTKLFLRDFQQRNRGRILNVASAAAFAPGPLMAAYYASKSYVLHLTEAIAAELRTANSPVTVSALCPGPVATEFNEVAGVHFATKSLSSEYVANYAIKKTLQGKTVIVPGATMKTARLLAKIVPGRLAVTVTGSIQKKKG